MNIVVYAKFYDFLMQKNRTTNFFRFNVTLLCNGGCFIFAKLNKILSYTEILIFQNRQKNVQYSEQFGISHWLIPIKRYKNHSQTTNCIRWVNYYKYSEALTYSNKKWLFSSYN